MSMGAEWIPGVLPAVSVEALHYGHVAVDDELGGTSVPSSCARMQAVLPAGPAEATVGTEVDSAAATPTAASVQVAGGQDRMAGSATPAPDGLIPAGAATCRPRGGGLEQDMVEGSAFGASGRHGPARGIEHRPGHVLRVTEEDAPVWLGGCMGVAAR